MIRCIGRNGPLRVLRVVLRELKPDLLAILVIAALMIPVPDPIQENISNGVLSILGIGASIFIGFRNSNAYSRWWEARTLWGSIINNCRAFHQCMLAVDDGSSEMDQILDRIRRRQVRHVWQLVSELRGTAPSTLLPELTTPEDPSPCSSLQLLERQALDVKQLAVAGHIDSNTRVLLMSTLSTLTHAQGGLERVRNQPIPVHYDLFIRMLTWFFAVSVYNRLDSAGHDPLNILVGLLFMTLFIVAERLGHFIEEPMSNRVFDLPMNRFCTTITANLLGPDHPLAQPRESAQATVWM